MFVVYVLYSSAFNKIYIGFTSNIENRMFAHNHISNKGWTKTFRPWKLVHSEEFEDKSSALKREMELKSSQGRLFIRDKILTYL